jgi:Vanadium chloroperoxidase N-terminal domain
MVPFPFPEKLMNIIMFWNSVLLECSRRDFTRGYPNGQQAGPIGTSRAMAIVHLAIHDAVAFETNKAAAAYLIRSPCRTRLVRRPLEASFRTQWPEPPSPR